MNIELLKKCGTVREFHNGQAICREGESGKTMYILLKGSVEIIINSFSDNVRSLGCMPEGSFFGEMSLLEDKPRSATIIANSDTVLVLEIGQEDFPVLLLNDSYIAYHLLLTLNNRLNNMLEKIEKEDKKFAFKYRRNSIYQSIQKLEVRSFDAIAKKDPDYVWTVLKYLSFSLEKLNREYIEQMKEKE